MKNCAVICEYNPFHSGHKYQLDCVRRTEVDNIICLMSGQFVQSAQPAFCDKSIRAECAVMCGADAVIELPTAYSTAGAGYFAEGGVKIASKIRNLYYLAMGATAPAEVILRLSDIKIAQKTKFQALLKKYIKHGKSYNIANLTALGELYTEKYCCSNENIDVSAVLNEPNNMLCIEYICAIDKLAPHIEPMIIPRRGKLHGDKNCDGEHISATAIRIGSEKTNIYDYADYLPANIKKIADFRKNHAPNMQIFQKICIFALKCYSTEKLADLRDCSEGMEYLIKKLCKLSDLQKIFSSEEIKKYGNKRISRIALSAVLGIDKRSVETEFCTRLLACSKKIDFSVLPSFVKADNAEIKAAAAQNENVGHVLDIDERAAALYNTLCDIDGDYYNYSLVKI